MPKPHFEQHHQRVAGYFDALATQHGYHFRTLDTGSEASQKRNYRIMSEVGDLQGKSILDIGCGLTQFYDYLTVERGLQVNYVGIDVSPEVVRLAQEYHPNRDIRLGDVLNSRLDGPYDYVFANGLFYIDHTSRFVQAFMKRAFQLCKMATCVCTISTYAPVKHTGESPIDPASFFRLSMRLTPHVVLRHDYAAHDFTTYLYQDSST